MTIQITDITIPNDQQKLKGRIYRPNKKGKYPAVAICHGYPGDTKNMDLAEEIALNNIIVLIFYYQGAWGSTGTYRFANLTTSTQTAIKYLKSLDYVDSTRIGLISHSMGALPLTKAMSKDNSIKTGVYMAPVSHISGWLSSDFVDNIIDEFVGMAEGKLAFGDKLGFKMDMIWAGGELNPLDSVAEIVAPILVVVGSGDKVTDPGNCKVLFDLVSSPKEWVLVDGADHGFSEHRLILQQIVLEWLKKNL